MNADQARRGVSIVVPVYADLTSLLDCARSLRDTVNPSVDRVLLVNDCGPTADEIERTLRELIADWAGFSYHRNPRNLGFVGTCNRAAFELDNSENDLLFLNSDTVCTAGFVDELSAVLHLDDSHGAVCPRSNDATIASLPYALRNAGGDRSVNRTAKVYGALRDVLPRFTLSPVAVGFCLLVRRELVRKFGLFDSTFSPGYGEENDFCLRIAEHGFVSVICHRSLVYHASGRSFSRSARTRLQAAHQAILVRRYPAYPAAVDDYLWLERDAVDVFADVLVPGEDAPAVLIDLDWPQKGSVNAAQLALLGAANESALNDSARFTVAVPDRDARAIARRFRGLTVERHSRIEGVWDVAFASTTRQASSQLARLNRCAPRWVFDDSVPADWTRFADATMNPETAATEAVSALVGEWRRLTVDIARLRSRWGELTAAPWSLDGGTRPEEGTTLRLLRRLAAPMPSRAVGLAAMVRSARQGRPRLR